MQTLRDNLALLAGGGRYHELVGGHFARAEDLYRAAECVTLTERTDVLVLYYFGYALWDRRGGLCLAQPSSIPGRPRTHVNAALLLERARGLGRVVLIVDDAGGSGPSRHKLQLPDVARTQTVLRVAGQPALPGPGGADRLSEVVGDTLGLLVETLPSASVAQAFRSVDQHIRQAGMRSAFQISAPITDDTLLFANRERSTVWRYAAANLESPAAGSREDGLQELLQHRSNEHEQKQAALILLAFATNDPSPDVRLAAHAALRPAGGRSFRRNKRSVARRVEPILPDWRHISAGFFVMGSDPEKDPDALPEEMTPERKDHRVFLDDFFMGRYPVTCGEWLRYVDSGEGRLPLGFSAEELASRSTLPVSRVNWHEARAYAEWLTVSARDAGTLGPHETIRLPFESEWERAARGTKGRIYPWGRRFASGRCNVRSTGMGAVVPVGTFSPAGDSMDGVADMAGNVWEWTLSLWGRAGNRPRYHYPYRMDRREDTSADDGVRRVIRGGAFYYFDDCVRCATRNVMFPQTRHSGGGLRLVLVSKGLPSRPSSTR